MKNRSTGRLGRLFNAAALSGNDARREPLRGFTLIELLVVVLIIGILSAIALPKYQKAVLKARASELLILGKSIVKAQQVYYMANGEYTQSLQDLDIDIPCTQDTHPDVSTVGRIICKNSRIYLYPGFASSILAAEGQFWINMYYDSSKKDLCSAGSKTAEELCLGLGGIYTYTDADAIKRYYL